MGGTDADEYFDALLVVGWVGVDVGGGGCGRWERGEWGDETRGIRRDGD